MLQCFGCFETRENQKERDLEWLPSPEPKVLDDAHAHDVAVSEASFYSCHEGRSTPGETSNITEGIGLDSHLISLLEQQSCRAHGAILGKPHSIDDLEKDLIKAKDNLKAVRELATTRRLERHLQTVDDDKGWINASSKGGGLELFYKHEKDSTVHSFRARCTLECPLAHILCIAREFDLSGGKDGWNPFALESIILQEWSPFSILAYALMWLPWPMRNISLLVGARGYDLLDECSCLVIDLVPGEESLNDCDIPKSYERSWKVKVCDGAPGSFIWFTPLPLNPSGGKARTKAAVTLSLDAGIKNVPQSLVAFILNILAPFIYSAVVKLVISAFSQPPSSKMAERLQKRLSERTDLYPMVIKRCEDYIVRKQHDLASTIELVEF